MENIGIVRRVDELGRIVIPKEMRKSLKVRSGDCLEIFLENGRLILIKEDLLEKNLNSIDNILKIFYKILDIEIVITDVDKIISVYAKSKDNLIGKPISKQIYSMIMDRHQNIIENQILFDDKKTNYLFQPIIANGDVIGSLILIKNDSPISEKEKLSAEIINNLFLNNLEI